MYYLPEWSLSELGANLQNSLCSVGLGDALQITASRTMTKSEKNGGNRACGLRQSAV